jgi:trans-aconitate methyltransferase
MVQSWAGLPSIEIRQKWTAVWPVLSRLPNTGLRVIDAGCGDGTWTAELATRRPGWQLLGIDLEDAQIQRAARDAKRLGLTNVQYQTTDFLEFRPPRPADAILSVSSAHYLVEQGLGPAIFRAFADWLVDGGRLVLYGPRRSSDIPMLRGLPKPFAMRDVLAVDGLMSLCAGAGLEIEQLVAVGRLPGTIAKQLARFSTSSTAARVVLYPLQLGLLGVDQARAQAPAADVRSSALLLVARRRARGSTPPIQY